MLLDKSIGPLNEDQEKFIHHIYKTSVFLNTMLEDLLDISTIESGTIDLRKEEFHISKLMDDILIANKIYARSKSIQLNLKVNDGQQIKIIADKSSVTPEEPA